jgi:hypothetical protein
MVGVLQGYQQQFGPQWQKAYGELVQHGKIPEGYRVLADLDQPSQVTTAADYQSVLKLLAQPNGHKMLVDNAIGRKNLPTAQRDVEAELNTAMAPFQETTSFSSGRQELYATMRSAATSLSLFYMSRDDLKPAEAVKKAVDGLLNNKWGMTNTMIYPKPLEAQVLGATRQVAASLTGDDVLPTVNVDKVVAGLRAGQVYTEGTGFRNDKEYSDAWAAAARRGQWVPNAGATGLNLMMQLDNGGMIPVRRRDGSIVSLDFNNLPAARPVTRENFINPPAPVTRGPSAMATFDE